MVDRPDSTQSAALDELLRRAHAGCDRFDEKLRGGLFWALGASAAIAAGCASLLELCSEATGAALCSIASGACLLWLGFTWLGTCRDAAGRLRSAGVRSRLRAELRLFARDVAEWPRAPKLLKLLIASRSCAALGLSALLVASPWKLVGLVASGGGASPRVLGLQLLGSAALGLSQLLSWARRAHRQHDPAALDDCQQAAQEFPAVLDLSEPLQLDTLFLEPTLLHQVVDALARWQVEERWPSTHIYTAALQRHLQRCLPERRVERGYWLGASRAAGVAALVIDDLVLVEVQRGFSTRRADAALTQVQAWTRSAPGKPIILAVFDAPSGDLLHGSASRSLTSLHEQSAFLAACMPGARRLADRAASEGPASRRPSSIPPSLA